MTQAHLARHDQQLNHSEGATLVTYGLYDISSLLCRESWSWVGGTSHEEGV
jgi:hypothetical protein